MRFHAVPLLVFCIAARAAAAADPIAIEVPSAILKETRRVRVSLPASFARTPPERRYPVTVVLDGGSLLAPVETVSRELARNGQIPEMILVAIENSSRLRDLTPPGLSVSGSSLAEGGDRFLDFIEKELLPRIDKDFRGGAPRTLVGHSSGGILVTYAAATRPAFRVNVALDTPIQLGEGWLAKKLLARAKAGGEPVRYVSYAARFDWPEADWRALGAAAPPSWKLHHERLERETHETMPMLGAYLGLREAFSDTSRIAAMPAGTPPPTTSILPYYDRLSASYGAPIAPPEALLRDVVEDLLIEGRGTEARAAYQRLAMLYGEPADGDAQKARIAEAEKRPPPSETVESLLATPFPSLQEMKGYLGTWTGTNWIDPASRTRWSLILREDAGRVAGEIVGYPAPGVELKRPLEYLKVLPAGLAFGTMNGMRPRGMLLYEGKRTSDLLEGEMRWGGVSFRMLDGSPPPVIRFELRRQ